MKIFSPKDLEAGKSILEDVPSNLADALTAMFVTVLNQELSLQWAVLLEQDVKELPPHFIYKFDREAVTQHLLDQVVKLCNEAGWKHTLSLVDTIIVAREPYYLGSGRGERQASLNFTSP